MEEHKHPGVNLLDRVDPVDTQSLFIHPYPPEPASEWDLYLFGKPGDGSRMHTIIEEKYGAMIDGGRDYTKTNCCKIVDIVIEGDEFIISENI